MAAGLAFLGSSAHAQWMYDEQGGAFSDTKTHIAFTGNSSGYGFGLRCTSIDDLRVVFMTPEEVENSSLKNLNDIGTEILVRVDQNEPYEFIATAQALPTGLGFFASTNGDFVEEFAEGQSDLAVAVRALGQIFHEVRFNTRESQKAIHDMRSGCGFSD